MWNIKVIFKILLNIFLRNRGRKISISTLGYNFNRYPKNKKILFIENVFSLKNIYTNIDKSKYHVIKLIDTKIPYNLFIEISNYKNIVVAEEFFDLIPLKTTHNIICVWHGFYGMKNFSGLWYLNYIPPFNKIIVDYNDTELVEKVFKMPKDDIKILGNQLYYKLSKGNNQKNINKIRDKLGIDKTKKKIYFISFSFEEKPKFCANIFFNLKKLSKSLNSDELILYNFHPSLYHYKRIHNVYSDNNIKHVDNKTCSTEELSLICSVLITDYSSTITEAIILNKPILFLIENTLAYDRGFIRKTINFPAKIISTKNPYKIISSIRNSLIEPPNKFYIDDKNKILITKSNKKIVEYLTKGIK